MDYQVYPPQEKLARFVKYHWALHNDNDLVPHERERVFPDGCIELIFNHGDPMRKFEDGVGFVQPRNIVHGQIKRFIELESTGKIGLFAARFLPAGLQPFIDFDVSALTDRSMTVSEIWGPRGQQLEQQILSAPDNQMRIATLEGFLLERLAQSKKIQLDIAACVDDILLSDGLITIDELADKYNTGKRHLERKFLSTVGLSQKMFARIVRFNKALQLIADKDFSTFTSVAHEGGFYDQAHFIRDFKDFTGLNPKQYFSENLEMVKFFNLE
ncbi:helix-turn-helix transcriptional regulator [Flavobacterium caeni]|uniref:Helix-turn-helix domain-containing protein n=1 Tax=Flavobacterium caeni TaxID=490189 RepID=A0A1G5JIQ2_9FLAO|nr:helix-turn-helix transcriptional regulator [Flavobacterium caeni]SCY87639.1 Helix-turn-helix domain-containing protein [Flavobacterium caeni]